MPDSASAAIERYRQLEADFKVAAERVQAQLEELIAALGLHATVSARAKTVASFGRKVFVKGYEDPWTQVTDNVGARVVLATVPDVDRVADAVAGWLIEPIVEDKRILSDPTRLEYSGVHVTGQVPGEVIESEPIKIEVQLRTIVQDAWSVVSHSLVYKPWIALQIEAQRRVMRLVALAEIFDEEVARAVSELKAEPGYAVVPLLDLAEGLAPSVGIYDGNRELSVHTLLGIRECLEDVDMATYRANLEALVSSRGDKIRHVVESYGPHSEFEGQQISLLVGQPESLIVMERMANAPRAFQGAWDLADFPDVLLEPLRQALELPG